MAHKKGQGSIKNGRDSNAQFRGVKKFGGEAILTRADHETGSARVAEAAENIDADIIINLQGDEPEIDPGDIDRLIDLQMRCGAFASTLACRFPTDARSGSGSPEDPSAVKAILGAAIGGEARWARYFTHVGIYAFTKSSLAEFAAAPPGALERIERLEQLRILERGWQLAVGLIARAAPGIDTPEDYEAFVKRMGEGAA